MTRSEYLALVNRRSEIKTELKDLQGKLAKENRGMTEEENKNFRALRAEDDNIQLQCTEHELEVRSQEVANFSFAQTRKSDNVVLAEIFRSSLNHEGIPAEYAHLRSKGGLLIPTTAEDLMMRADSGIHNTNGAAPVVPITIHEIIEALEPKTIYGQLGLKIQTGIQGDWNFPTVSGGTAEWAGENDSTTAALITLGKIAPTPHRLPTKVIISNTAIWQSAGTIKTIIMNRLAKLIPNKLDATLLSTTQLSSLAPVGPWVNATSTVAASGALSTLTRQNLLDIRSKIYENDVDLETPVFILNPAAYFQLANTPVDKGSGRFVLDLATGTIDGVRAIMSTRVKAGDILFGEMSECMLGQFGDMTLSVDSQSAAVSDKDVTVATINSRWDMKVRHQEAFGKVTYTVSAAEQAAAGGSNNTSGGE